MEIDRKKYLFFLNFKFEFLFMFGTQYSQFSRRILYHTKKMVENFRIELIHDYYDIWKMKNIDIGILK